MDILLRERRRSSRRRCFFDRNASITQLRIVCCLWEVVKERRIQEEQQFSEVLILKLEESNVAVHYPSD